MVSGPTCGLLETAFHFDNNQTIYFLHLIYLSIASSLQKKKSDLQFVLISMHLLKGSLMSVCDFFFSGALGVQLYTRHLTIHLIAESEVW